MAEAGGPSIAEVQPKPAGVVEEVKGILREKFTPTGRAEVMAQKQMDEILKQVPEEKRVEAMKMLEARRPDLVASNLPGAKDRLVKEAVVGAAALGVLAVGGGVAIAKREAIMDAAFSLRIPKPNVSKLEDSINKVRVVAMRKANFAASIRRATDPVKGFIEEMKLWPFNKLDANPREPATQAAGQSARVIDDQIKVGKSAVPPIKSI
ncbi:MAG: hypothetical protein AAB557_05480 [Patescibacteria group bacterium]